MYSSFHLQRVSKVTGEQARGVEEGGDGGEVGGVAHGGVCVRCYVGHNGNSEINLTKISAVQLVQDILFSALPLSLEN